MTSDLNREVPGVSHQVFSVCFLPVFFQTKTTTLSRYFIIRNWKIFGKLVNKENLLYFVLYHFRVSLLRSEVIILGNRLLADESVVLVVGVVLGVPGKVSVEVHVKPRAACWFVLLETKNNI